jgi:hypothetical protein
MTTDGDGERRAGAGATGPTEAAAELDDEELLARLGATIGGAEEPPDDVGEFARLSFGLRRVDDELAELVTDSALENTPVGVRAGGGAARLLTFEAEGGELELQVTPSGTGADPAGWEMLGQVVPPGPAGIRVERAGGAGALEVDADDLGRFSVRGSGSGPWRLICRRPGRPPLVSQWILFG